MIEIRYNQEELLENLKFAPNGRKAFEKLTVAAQYGNIAASFELAMHYLNGVWDVRSIQDDMLLGQLKPATADVNQDPYLIAPRDPDRALVFCRQVVDYCKSKSMLLNVQKELSKRVIEAFDTVKNPNQANNPYLKDPFCRPVILKNSIDSVFGDVAVNSLTQLVLCFTFNFVFEAAFIIPAYVNFGETEKTGILLLFGLLVNMPVLVVGLILYFSGTGIIRSKPCCSCKNIRSAYSKVVSRLPESFAAQLNDPFTTTNWFIRNTLSIFIWYCVVGLIVSLVALVFIFDINDPITKLPVLGDVSSLLAAILAFYAAVSFALNIFAVKNTCSHQNDAQDVSITRVMFGIPK